MLALARKKLITQSTLQVTKSQGVSYQWSLCCKFIAVHIGEGI